MFDGLMTFTYDDAYSKVYKVKGEPEDKCSICGNDETVWGYDPKNPDPNAQFTEKEWAGFVGKVPYSSDVSHYHTFCIYCHWQNEMFLAGYDDYLFMEQIRNSSLKSRQEKKEQLNKRVFDLIQEGKTKQEIADEIGCTRIALNGRLTRMRKEGWKV